MFEVLIVKQNIYKIKKNKLYHTFRKQFWIPHIYTYYKFEEVVGAYGRETHSFLRKQLMLAFVLSSKSPKHMDSLVSQNKPTYLIQTKAK